jgi:transposase
LRPPVRRLANVIKLDALLEDAGSEQLGGARRGMVVVEDHQQREPSMSEITTIGLDLAKNIFQVHGVNETDSAVEVKRLRRSQVVGFFAGLAPCLVGMEACATAHYWARELTGLGHEVRLMPPQYVTA